MIQYLKSNKKKKQSSSIWKLSRLAAFSDSHYRFGISGWARESRASSPRSNSSTRASPCRCFWDRRVVFAACYCPEWTCRLRSRSCCRTAGPRRRTSPIKWCHSSKRPTWTWTLNVRSTLEHTTWSVFCLRFFECTRWWMRLLSGTSQSQIF